MNFSNEIKKTREQIQGIETEHARLISQPRSRQQVAECVRDGVRAVEPFAASETSLTLKRLAAGQHADLMTASASAMTPQGPVSISINLLPLMVRLLGVDAVSKALLVGIDNIANGLEPDARDHRLATIATELHDLQTREESLIRDAALTGQEIQRRSNANPAYVLTLEVGK